MYCIQMISLLHPGHRMKHCLFHISLLLRICSFLDPKGPNVCPRRATTEVNGTITVLEHTITECCPDYKYFEKSDSCQECPVGRFGRNCENTCLPNTYGRKCSEVCSCSKTQHCDSEHGCICSAGYTGSECTSVCKAGYYGEQCQKGCVCGNNADCHPMSGHCICPAGWIGQYCTENCFDGWFGVNCSKACNCRADGTCDPVTGGCIDGDSTEKTKSDGQGHQPLTVYILMAAAVTGLVVLVVVVIKVKEAITSSFKVSKMVTNQVSVHDVSKVTASSSHEQDEQVIATTSIDDASATNFATEDIYCEIDEFQ